VCGLPVIVIPEKLESAAAALGNALITPHIGYNTREASANMLRISIETVQAFARGERLHVVNGL
jgi:phosphoglycerate dehydrogenase-like enzyme